MITLHREIPIKQLENELMALNQEGYTVYCSKLNGETIILSYRPLTEIHELKRRSLTLKFPEDDILGVHKTKKPFWKRLFSMFDR